MRALVIWLALLLLLPTARGERDPMAEPRFASVAGTTAIVDGVVSALAQDERGLIWVGTAVGLARYDGYQAKTYPVNGQGHGTRYLLTVLPDRDGVLWVGMEGDGLARFDSVAERWTFFRHDPAIPSSITPGSVLKLARAGDGRLWVGLARGLDLFDPRTGRFEHLRAAQGHGLPADGVGALLVDGRGDLWVGTPRGLVRRAANAAHFEPVGGAELAVDITALAADAGGRIWVGARDGRLLLVDVTQRAARVLEGGSGLSTSPVLSLLGVGQGEVWAGRAAGVELRGPDGRLLQALKRGQRKPWTPSGSNFVALLQDRAGTLWVGGNGSGLQHYNPMETGLWVRRQDDDADSPLADSDIRSVLQLRNGEVWLGTLERGIAVLDRRLRTVAAIRPAGEFVGMVGALAQAADGSVWAGTQSARIVRFGPDRRVLEVHSTGSEVVRRLFVDHGGTLWVGTAGSLCRLAPGERGLQPVPLADVGGHWVGNVNAIVEDRQGQVWVGSEGGLFRFEQGSLRVLGPGAGLPQGYYVVGLLIDAGATLWVDTNFGLFRRRPDGGFESVSGRYGLGARSFGANLLADGQGRIWTHRGMFDPASGIHTPLGRADGVDIGTGWYRSYGQLDDGRLLFGGSTGLLVVEPQRFHRWDFKPSVVATGLHIDGRPEPVGTLAEGLELAPPRRAFAIEFASLDYSEPSQNRYRYRLKGYDDAWIYVSAELRVASYANLSPGHYELEVQGSNRLGEWSDQVLRILVGVAPAWWQTWWARCLAALLTVSAIYGLVRWRTRLLEQRQALLEQRVHERTAALQALSEELKQQSLALEASSLCDPLTGLNNRRFLTQHIDLDVATALRLCASEDGADNADLIFMLIDVDHFKQVNDQHGHAAGDAVLVQMADRLRQVCRDSDHIVRWGGEEFLVVARHGARSRAGELVERVRRAVADTPFTLPEGQPLAKTCSIGYACFPLSSTHPEAIEWATVVDLADGALYEAKRTGRNRWVGVRAATPGLDAQALQHLARQQPGEWLAGAQLIVERMPVALPP